MELEMLAARENSGQDLMWFGCRQAKDHVLGRLLERLEQSIERRSGEHVHFVDHIDLVTCLVGTKCHPVTDRFTDIVHARV